MDCETYGVICTSRICDGYAKVMEYGVMRTTTRIVNEKISMGKAEKTEM